MPGLLELMRRTLGERINVNLDVANDVYPIEVDRAQLEAALLNLAVNARDAMPEGGDLSISVGTQTLDESKIDNPGDYAVISVSDTGTGMSPEVLQRVFEPFFTTKESGKGTGLGLSMVYGFVQQSHGHVEIDSAPNQGTTIRIFLPRAHGTAERSLNEKQMALVKPFGEGQTVLVVEDNPAVRQVAISTLHSLGFDVVEAETGDEAAQVLKTNDHVRLVLSDIRMPGGLSGIDLARFIKSEKPDVHILLTTGYVDSEEIIEDVELLYKPYRATDLADKIQALLEKPKQPARNIVSMLAAISA
jgi:CheY-like chemotaxis protein